MIQYVSKRHQTQGDVQERKTHALSYRNPIPIPCFPKDLYKKLVSLLFDVGRGYSLSCVWICKFISSLSFQKGD